MTNNLKPIEYQITSEDFIGNVIKSTLSTGVNSLDTATLTDIFFHDTVN